MARTARVYLNPRPLLAIETTGGRELGRCYYATFYKVTSRFPLDRNRLQHLRDAGFLGSGQEFIIRGLVRPDGSLTNMVDIPTEADYRYKPDPSGFDVVPCSEVDEATNQVIRTPSINPYSGKEDPPSEVPYYVYEIESRVDSSD